MHHHHHHDNHHPHHHYTEAVRVYLDQAWYTARGKEEGISCGIADLPRREAVLVTLDDDDSASNNGDDDDDDGKPFSPWRVAFFDAGPLF